MTNLMPEQPTAPSAVMRRIPVAFAAVLIGGIAGYVGIYGFKGAGGDPVCRAAVDTAKRIAPLARGEGAALTMASKPLKLPDLAFDDADGKPKKLSDWQGKTVLVNLWATWCVPCRQEMPSLERLQTKLKGAKFGGGA